MSILLESLEKKPSIKIGTHGGEFHPDEVFAITTLMTAVVDKGSIPNGDETPSFTIVRSRDQKELADCDLLIDVGSEYNPAEGKFDHHQEDGAGTRANGIPYASFGLIWKELGLTVCDGDRIKAGFVDDHFVQIIDAYDNGFQLFEARSREESLPCLSDIRPGQEIFDCNSLSGKSESDKFDRAVAVAGMLLEGRISHAGVVCENVKVIEDAINDSKRPDIVKLPIAGTSWQETLPRITDGVLFVIQEEDDFYVVRAVPETPNGSTRNIYFPEHWTGIENTQMIKDATGIDGVTFIHGGGFYAKTETEESAHELADKAIELAKAA